MYQINTAGPSNLALVYRLAYNGDGAAGQLAVFQGASETPISGFIRAEGATRKTSQLAAARRVALKMGRRLRCSSVTYRFRYAPSTTSPARTALPAAHFERNDVTILCETVHYISPTRMQAASRLGSFSSSSGRRILHASIA